MSGKLINFQIILVLLCLVTAVFAQTAFAQGAAGFSISALPASLRLDPSDGRVIDDAHRAYAMPPLGEVLKKNWVYDGREVRLHAARGEYVSFQLVVENLADSTLHDIAVDMQPFSAGGHSLAQKPELFLEWAVQVKAYSTGYERGNLGGGWYPDALIPLELLEQDVAQKNHLAYPLELPDFHNRIDHQRFLLIWIDQYVPFEQSGAPAGEYLSQASVKIGGKTLTLPVKLKIWNFALPNENRLAGNLQHEGFIRAMDENLELKIYQLFKKNRVVPADPTYTPAISVAAPGKVAIDWSSIDSRLGKYLTGEAFTSKYGYRGPGYGEPLEQFVLPFDVYGKHGTRGWPDTGTPEVERKPENVATYVEAIRQVREHILSLVDPDKIRLIVYLNGLDESYFPEAWDRMVFYGKMFHQYFPESRYRVDGGYSEEAMKIIHEAIDYWCCHTITYSLPTIEAYRKLGVQDWLYGPMLYEREENGWCGSSTFMDLPLVNERAISWSCWKYRTLTWCSWGIGSNWRSAWYNSETWKDYFRDQGAGPLSYRRYNGNALAVYSPGIIPNVNVPCPSLRLKAMRDGVEEYEYMRLLSALDKDSTRADQVVERIIKKPFGPQAIGDLDIWDYNPAKWDEAVLELGGMIEKASGK